jgi:hypothetical protein
LQKVKKQLHFTIFKFESLNILTKQSIHVRVTLTDATMDRSDCPASQAISASARGLPAEVVALDQIMMPQLFVYN